MGELLKRLVGDVVRHVAELIGAAGHAAGQDLLLGADIEQCVLHLQASAGRHDVADHHVVDANCLPVTEDHFAGLRRLADHVLPGQRLEVAGVAQVVADDIGHVFRQHVAPGSRTAPRRWEWHGRYRWRSPAGRQPAQHLPPGPGEQRNANQGTHRLKSSGLKDDAALTIQAVEGSPRQLLHFGNTADVAHRRHRRTVERLLSPLERLTLALVMVPSGSISISTSTLIPLRADGGRRHCWLTRLTIVARDFAAHLVGRACWRSVVSESNSANACAFLSSAALRAAAAAAAAFSWRPRRRLSSRRFRSSFGLLGRFASSRPRLPFSWRPQRPFSWPRPRRASWLCQPASSVRRPWPRQLSWLHRPFSPRRLGLGLSSLVSLLLFRRFRSSDLLLFQLLLLEFLLLELLLFELLDFVLLEAVFFASPAIFWLVCVVAWLFDLSW